MKNLLFVLVVLGVVACGGVPATRIDASKAQFAGKPTDQEAIRKIKGYFDDVLADPESLRMRCSPIRKGWGRQTMNDKPTFGWVTYCNVDAKNKLGEYAGVKTYLFIINGENFTAIDNPYAASGSDTHSGVLD